MKQRMKHGWLGLAFVISLAACGRGEMVDVRLLTPFDSNPAAQNLMESFGIDAGIKSGVGAIDCEQGQLFAVVKTGQGDLDFTTFPIPMRLAPAGLTGTPPHYNYASWLQGYSSFPPIIIPVPRGTQTGFGVGGAIYESSTTEDGLHCSRKNGAVVNPSATLIGHVNRLINEPQNIAINVWVLDSIITTTPAITAVCGVPGNEDLLSQQCWNKNFFKLTLSCAGSPCASVPTFYSFVKVEYFRNNTGSPAAVQYYSYSSVQSGVYVPDIDQIRVSLIDNSDVEGTSGLFIEKDAAWSGSSATLILTNTAAFNTALPGPPPPTVGISFQRL